MTASESGDVVPQESEEPEGTDDAQELPEEDSGEDAVLPEPIEAVLEEVPPEQREKMRSTFLGLSQYMGPMPHPLFRKMKDEHLDMLIKGADKHSERSYEDMDRRRGHVRFLSVAGLLAFLAASGLFLWAGQIALLESLVTIAVVFAGGIGVGVGFLKKPGS